MDNSNNILSYIKWRGDIDLSALPFNEVDGLAFAVLSYIDFSGIVSDDGKQITIKEAAKKYFADGDQRHNSLKQKTLLRLMAASKRFANAKLSYYIAINTDQTQFSAIRITLDDGTNYIAFRGTDDTIVGWKEDFEISFKTTAAQSSALKYLKRLLNEVNKKFTLVGHSKGGNLAEFAALNLPENQKEMISGVYTYDSPGLSKRVQEIHSKIHRYVPEFSIIGRLFEPSEGEAATIVVSDRPKLAQHDPVSWQIEGSHFVTSKHRNAEATLYNQMINKWIEEATPQEREALTNDLFSALAASGSDKITQLNKNGFGGFGAILFSLTNSSRRTRFVLGSLWRTIWNSIKALHLNRLFITKQSLVGWAMIVLGIISLTSPTHAYRAFGWLAALTVIIWSGIHIVKAATSTFKNRQKRFFIITYLITFGLAIAIMANRLLLAFLAHYVLGIFLLSFSYFKLRKVILKRVKEGMRKFIDIVEGLLAFAVGIIVIIRPQSLTKETVVFLGIFLIVYGLFKLLLELWQQRKKMPTNHR